MSTDEVMRKTLELAQSQLQNYKSATSKSELKRLCAQNPVLTEADRKRCGEIIRELYNNPECSIGLAVDAGSQLQNLLSVVDAQDRKIVELEQRVKVLTDALKPFANFACDCGKCFNCKALAALNATPQQIAEQIDRWHVEWMKTLPVAGYADAQQFERWDTLRGTVFESPERCYMPFSRTPYESDLSDCTFPLYAIPKLPETKE